MNKLIVLRNSSSSKENYLADFGVKVVLIPNSAYGLSLISSVLWVVFGFRFRFNLGIILNFSAIIIAGDVVFEGELCCSGGGSVRSVLVVLTINTS